MATYSQPTLTLNQTPSKFSPVYAPNWFKYTGNFTNTTATDAYLVADIYILNQFGNISGTNIQDYAGRFKVPVRNDTTFVINPEQILKSYVTYPYNSLIPEGSTSVYPSRYVNEYSGFGNPTSSFPTLAPECDGIVNYKIGYGMQYNPNWYFTNVSYFGSTAGTTIFYVTGTNSFASIGDTVTIAMDSGLYSYYNGTASITGFTTISGYTIMVTDKPFNATLGAISLTASGYVQTVTHMVGTTSTYYAYNGVRQWNEKDINYDNIYMVRQQGYTSSLFPSTSTASNFQFMNDWGTTQSQAIPIKQGQAERVRFLADITSTSVDGTLTQRIAEYRKDTYNSSGTLVSSVTNALQDTPGGGSPYPNKCFTLQVFDGTETITDGYYYKFTLRSYNTSLALYDWASIWYVGDTKCSQYENIRIKFLNRQGTWAYWNFNKDNKQTTTINRTEYKIPYQYDYTLKPTVSTTLTSGSRVTNPFTLAKLRGQNVLSISATDTFTLNSDWITEEQYAYLQQLLTSPQVFIFYDTYTMEDNTVVKGVNVPIILTDTQYTFKTRNRDRIFNLQITYKYAYDIALQNP